MKVLYSMLLLSKKHVGHKILKQTLLDEDWSMLCNNRDNDNIKNNNTIKKEVTPLRQKIPNAYNSTQNFLLRLGNIHS